MFRGTTPVIKAKINNDNLDFNDIKEIWLTIKNVDTEMNFTKDDLSLDYENKVVMLELTQEQTLEFEGYAELQIRILTMDERAWATKIKTVDFSRIIKEGVING